MATAAPPEPITEEAREAVDQLIGTLEGLSIHQRILGILGELPAIGKDQRNEQQKFMYRGHDDVMNALNPLLAKWGVYFSPNAIKRVTGERTTRSGSTMYEVNLCVRYTFWGAGGDFIEATAWGEGTDSGDKSTNKAMTMALKNVLAQVFAISTAELSDADAESPQETRRGSEAPGGRAERATREEAFNPGTQLLANAVRGDDYAEQLGAKMEALAPDLDWHKILDVAAVAALGPKSKRTAAQRKEGIYRWSNTIAKLELLADQSEGYHPELGLRAGPEGDDLVRAAVKFGYGYDLKGDLPRREGAEAPASPEPSAAPEEPSEREDDGPPGGMAPSDEGM